MQVNSDASVIVARFKQNWNASKNVSKLSNIKFNEDFFSRSWVSSRTDGEISRGALLGYEDAAENGVLLMQGL
jgi:3-dehydroquinate dehydratase